MPDVRLNHTTIESLASSLRGALLRPDGDGYEEARGLWNAMIDERPALIVRCTGAADVIAALAFAREHGLTVAVRGGGHNVAGLATVDGGMMIDLSRMRAVHVDPEARIARVQGGALWGDVDHETQAFGLATPSGIISTTGVAGLTLGGGFGWLARAYGLAADNLVSADVVTADGELVRASEQEHADLFWAIRGGGGNFGIVTEFTFRLHAVGPEVLFGPTVYRLEDAPEVLRHYRAFTADMPNECTVYPDFLTAPPLPFLPEEVHGSKVLFLIQCYAGDVAKGEEVLRPLREFGRPIADAVAPTPYAEAQRRSDPLFPKGGRYYWKSHNLAALSDGVVDTLAECASTMPNPLCDILVQQLGGRMGEIAPDATAYPHRDAGFVVTLGGRSERPAEDDACIDWARACHSRLGRHGATGVYMNFLSRDEGDERLQAAFGDNAERLQRVKTRFDPDSVFRRNHTFEPRRGS